MQERNNSLDRARARSLDRSICVASCACSEMGVKHNAEEHADPQIAKAIRTEAKKSFEITMRQAAMEFDELSGGSGELDFREFSRMIREREVGVHNSRRQQTCMHNPFSKVCKRVSYFLE